MIQAIVYDAVGTLMHVRPSVEAVYAKVGRRFGSALDHAEIRRRFVASFAEQDRLDQKAGWRTSEAREAERWRAIVAHVFHDAVDPDACFTALFDTFAGPEVWAFDSEWDDVSRAIKQQGIRQALASNFDARLHGIVAAMPGAERLERVVVSSEVGWRKPSPEFFRHLLHATQLPAGDVLFVGDDLGNDYEAARLAGMNSLLFDPGRRHIDRGADRIERLGELVPWICRTGSGSTG